MRPDKEVLIYVLTPEEAIAKHGEAKGKMGERYHPYAGQIYKASKMEERNGFYRYDVYVSGAGLLIWSHVHVEELGNDS